MHNTVDIYRTQDGKSHQHLSAGHCAGKFNLNSATPAVPVFTLNTPGPEFPTTQNNPAGSQKARMTSPANGSVLPGASTTLNWDTGTGVTKYQVYAGNAAGGYDLHRGTAGTSLTSTCTLPTDGRKIYVTLWSLVGGAWQSSESLYTASPTP